MKICIVGGASSTYSAATLLGRNPNHQISLLTRQPYLWQKEITCRMVAADLSETDRLTTRFHRVSNDPADVVSDADVILLITPVHAYNSCLEWIAPYLARKKDIFVGFLYGQGGVNWMAQEVFRRHGIENAHYWSFGLSPWICRSEIYGQVGINYGSNYRNIICTSSDLCFDTLNAQIFDDFSIKYFGYGEIHRAQRFIELTLSVDNQIIHPSRCYGLWKSAPMGWSSSKEVPYFYRSFDDISTEIMSGIDNDFENIRNRVRAELPNTNLNYMMNYLDLEHFSYDSQSSDIRSSFTKSQTLCHIYTPVREFRGRQVIDARHRFFLDDTYLGINIGKEFAERFGISVPTIDLVSSWCTDFMSSQGVSKDILPPSVLHRNILNEGNLFS